MSRLMCSKRLRGDECFNNFEDKTFHHHKHTSVFFNAIGASIGALNCMKIATLLQNKHNSVQYCPFTAPESFSNIVDKNMSSP